MKGSNCQTVAPTWQPPRVPLQLWGHLFQPKQLEAARQPKKRRSFSLLQNATHIGRDPVDWVTCALSVGADSYTGPDFNRGQPEFTSRISSLAAVTDRAPARPAVCAITHDGLALMWHARELCACLVECPHSVPACRTDRRTPTRVVPPTTIGAPQIPSSHAAMRPRGHSTPTRMTDTGRMQTRP